MKNVKCCIRSDQRRQDNSHLIYLRYTYNRKFVILKIDDNLSVTKPNWNIKSGRVRRSDNYDQINRILENAENSIFKVILNLIENGKEPTLISVKREYYKAMNKFTGDSPLKIDEKKFIKDFQDFISVKTEYDKVSKETLKTYTTTLNKLIGFQKLTQYSLQYETIDSDFYFKFLKYLRGGYSENNNVKPLYDNSVDKHIKNIKLFMNYSLGKGKHTNFAFQSFKRTKTKADFVVLHIDEIKNLYYNYKPKTRSAEEIRDMFIFGCATGLRFSDLTKLSNGNFKITRDPITNEIIDGASYSWISAPIQKTTETIKIPFNNFIVDMIEKYNIGNKEVTFLRQNIQVFNREIKKICRDAGIIEPIKVSKKLNNKMISTEKAKCEFIASHTMRRTFITYLATLTEISNIQAVSGHKDIKVLSDYVKRNEDELNQVKGCINDIFNMPVSKPPQKAAKLKVNIRQTKLISRK